ncbi:hypothetical protein [Nocardioides daphniae]|uniref:Uncharacterized protein n=1 Tax=Nocardioides daphniae TaxID=402297 RepID=A0A4P7UE24_9ACTN|nr:hypothetical protein [Nocardioides daphniae]QCC78533.1 hypothetical protein E2C04_17405 [Nocardioides daphniae]
MTDHDPSDDHLRDSDDVVDEEVRSLLADVRADAPMPASVASRLDDVLASLVAERADGGVDDAAPVAPTAVDLAAERGRRRRRTWLGVAAAAVVLVAAGAVVPQLVSSDDRSTSADSVRDPDAAGSVDGVPSLTRADLAEELQSYLLAEAVTESAAAAASETPASTSADEVPGAEAPLDESLDTSAQADRRPMRGGDVLER